MTAVDNLWYTADEARQQAEQTFHRLRDRYDPLLEYERTKHVPRRRFRTLAERIQGNGLPYGAHTLVYRDTGALLLVYHEGVDMWVLPGGEVAGEEGLREGARRELREEAGVDATYDGLGILAQVRVRARVRSEEYDTWGVLPVFEAQAAETDLSVADPDGEISAAEWFETLPEDTRDREELLAWRERRF